MPQIDQAVELSQDELSWLERYARNDQSRHAPVPTLARLEQLGLLMRGWSRTYVVTRRGRAALGQARQAGA